MVTAEHYGHNPGAMDLLQTCGDPPVALFYKARYYRNVTVVDDGQVLEDRDLLGRIVGPEEVGDAPYGLRSEAGAGPKGGTSIEGGADNSGVSVFEIPDIGKAHERPHP